MPYASPKNMLDVEKFLSTKLKLKPDDVYDVFEIDLSAG
jgi:type IV secretion system protein VirD4